MSQRNITVTSPLSGDATINTQRKRKRKRERKREREKERERLEQRESSRKRELDCRMRGDTHGDQREEESTSQRTITAASQW